MNPHGAASLPVHERVSGTWAFAALRSAGGAEPSQCDAHKPSNCRLGWERTGRFESTETVIRKFGGGDVVADVAGPCGVGDEIADHCGEFPVRPGHVATSVEERGEGGILKVSLVMLRTVMLMIDEGVGLEHRLEAASRIPGLVTSFGEVFEMSGDLALMPRQEYRFDVGKVLVQRGPADSRFLGDPGHGYGQQAVPRHELGRGVENGIADLAAMCLDGLCPEPRHGGKYKAVRDTLIRQRQNVSIKSGAHASLGQVLSDCDGRRGGGRRHQQDRRH